MLRVLHISFAGFQGLTVSFQLSYSSKLTSSLSSYRPRFALTVCEGWRLCLCQRKQHCLCDLVPGGKFMISVSSVGQLTDSREQACCTWQSAPWPTYWCGQGGPKLERHSGVPCRAPGSESLMRATLKCDRGTALLRH